MNEENSAFSTRWTSLPHWPVEGFFKPIRLQQGLSVGAAQAVQNLTIEVFLLSIAISKIGFSWPRQTICRVGRLLISILLSVNAGISGRWNTRVKLLRSMSWFEFFLCFDVFNFGAKMLRLTWQLAFLYCCNRDENSRCRLFNIISVAPFKASSFHPPTGRKVHKSWNPAKSGRSSFLHVIYDVSTHWFCERGKENQWTGMGWCWVFSVFSSKFIACHLLIHYSVNKWRYGTSYCPFQNALDFSLRTCYMPLKKTSVW